MKNAISTDFHAHILPGADHGSDGLEMSLKQLSLIASYGVRTVVATPHFYPMKDSVNDFVEKRSLCAAELKSCLAAHHPAVLLGAEVLVCEGMERMDDIEELCVSGTDTILLEMPMTKWKDAIYDTVYEISKKGLSVVMAHVDRYDPEYVEQLFDLGVKAQLNPGAFLNGKSRRLAFDWISDGHIVALGSDLHGADPRSYKMFAKAVRHLGDRTPVIESSIEEYLIGAVAL